MVTGKLITAFSFDDITLKSIANRFEKIIGEPISFTVEIDSELIGGFIAVINNRVYKVYDKSIASQLKSIRKYLQHSALTIDQIGSENSEEQTLEMDYYSPQFSSDEFVSAAKGLISEYDEGTLKQNIGQVISAGDGVVHIIGLEHCKYGELLEFENNAKGIALNMEMDQVGAVLLTNGTGVVEGSSVRNTETVVSVPVGKQLLGRVINPLGEPLDGKGFLSAEHTRPIESEAPPIFDRQAVREPLETGILSIDSMIPIGKGQRELIIGDRQTGKTAIAVDTILNQKGKDVICIYVAIGQKASTVADIVRTLTDSGAMEYSIIVAAFASDSAPMQYIAPYAGCAMAEEFMQAGKDVLIVYDDLSKHAVSYRAMSLLLRRPPGREAYPGDVFYLHSRLLERAAKLSDRIGGGSMTALPIIETLAGDISAYIPTNVISITDGQIFLESELFNAGMRPAINVGLSVSRVGGSAQTKAMRKVSGQLRLDLAQYRELAVFAQFASDLDKSTQEQLNNGVRLSDSLIQPQFHPMAMADQVILLSMITRRKLLGIPLKKIAEFNQGYINFVSLHHPEIREEIEKTGELKEESFKLLGELADEYKTIFLGGKQS